MTPVIAIPRLGPSLKFFISSRRYEAALTAAGARVRWIGPENIAAAADCDGLLLPGGADVDPRFYGQEKSRSCGKQNPLRDQLDPQLLRAFLPTGKPILGICRGMQMLNVYLGGTLHQDIRNRQGVCHQRANRRTHTVHHAAIEPGTRLHGILGADRVPVNSLHHQSVDLPGRELRICARCEDGTVEAIELTGHRFCLGVQWHPEMIARDLPEQAAILRAFVQSCG